MVSPLLANVYLHYVFDQWVEVRRARKWQKGDVKVVRYADDLVLGFQCRNEAERFLREFRKRLAIRRCFRTAPSMPSVTTVGVTPAQIVETPRRRVRTSYFG